MARVTFFSFHYQRDIWRVNQIRNVPEVLPEAAAGFRDASLWEDAKRKGDDVVKRMIDNGLSGTTVTVVCIGEKTAGRKFINYEIQKSLDRGNGIVGLRINHLEDHYGQIDAAGDIPNLLSRNSVPIYKYTNASALAEIIEAAAKKAGK